MSDFADAIARDILSRVEPVARQLATDVQADVQRRCSVPVGRAGRRIIRSRPGEPPRRETGGYVASIESQVTSGADSVRATIFTDAKLGGWLEHGTSRMAPRPHWRDAARDWADEALRRFNESLAGPSGN